MTDKVLEVSVPREDILSWQNPVHVANVLIRGLINKGAPIEGGLFPVRILRGRIVIEEDAFEGIVMRWEP